MSMDGTVLECLQSVSITFTADTIDVTCKNPTGAKQFITGAKDWSAEGGGLRTIAGNGVLFSQLYAAYEAQDPVPIAIGGQNSGDKLYSGEAYISSLSLNSDNVGSVDTYSVSLKGTGTVTETTVA